MPGARARMQKMFQTAQAKAKPAKVPVDDASADALLDDILGNLDGGAAGSSKCVRHMGPGLPLCVTVECPAMLPESRALRAEHCGSRAVQCCAAAQENFMHALLLSLMQAGGQACNAGAQARRGGATTARCWHAQVRQLCCAVGGQGTHGAPAEQRRGGHAACGPGSSQAGAGG